MRDYVSPKVAAAAASTRTEAEVRAQMRYCCVCLFFDLSNVTDPTMGRCAKASSISADRFIAPEFDKPALATSARALSSMCGPDAKWFEPSVVVSA